MIHRAFTAVVLLFLIAPVINQTLVLVIVDNSSVGAGKAPSDGHGVTTGRSSVLPCYRTTRPSPSGSP